MPRDPLHRLHASAVEAVAAYYAARGNAWAEVVARRTAACRGPATHEQFEALVLALADSEETTLPLLLRQLMKDKP